MVHTGLVLSRKLVVACKERRRDIKVRDSSYSALNTSFIENLSSTLSVNGKCKQSRFDAQCFCVSVAAFKIGHTYKLVYKVINRA